ncbi:glutamine synthetase [Streptomyces sp. NPDC005402]|uniref:glutamine synthetase n=1 Tax=Streptomyces sp. NPDC005402 TaxID=3155338 RepID=UPI0033A53B94
MTKDDHQPPSDLGGTLHRRSLQEARSGRGHFLRNKKSEWEEYRSEVTAFELRKNLPVL